MAFRKRTSNPPITQPGTEHGTERGTVARFGALLPLMRSSPTAEFIALYERLTLGCGYVYDGCRGENNASAGLTKANGPGSRSDRGDARMSGQTPRVHTPSMLASAPAGSSGSSGVLERACCASQSDTVKSRL
eukprot:CAMPEP_0181244482 /NCGR_PEP_ID=MMETSP1096-20121128/42888_1 /TAXON_ID=156174 ORGANISM="Chrysochromulina ericina, Strain CCMP281" /NCGR_SAMPLE_ID=MMETSP1096 /ASSEMBLY_ACC=CAM_ASM_000453 /LENGTH=132 /DNA_ID=CAMNT_0023341043 /DNA_START=32 /DNA_END=427 /DNA_ORIENTATION=-